MFYVPDTDDSAFGPTPLECLKELIAFSGTRKLTLPNRFQDLFSLVRLADYLDFEMFLLTVAELINVPRFKLSNINGMGYGE